ncbi:methylenetetrahydrofolate reductase [Leptogranulimonas caecicola]|jgi:methylenetetrahydrofolate reductase (NADPH)|uniref:Methylenetetrahydrofolate reductase n=1 Tax=Muricaecibacterium torontonense TaxID=3032871 RepID=A0A4S2F489_9ACTN|nr:methylenetetrahydrofolate reductase [Muricaecibacterium torontonense]MCI8675146.1 methylenetetrahydrofolate reductase [NAD(P)H] [Atopobiaceae bacterium]TGY63227.1 methylenetetrahydrofolate reductase [NAD(P)H] [Muricaecibacterium torontonense]
MATKTVSQIFATQKLPVSFEIFPPKGDLSQEEAQQVASQLAPLDPAFISVTYSAGGSGNSSRTLEVARLIQRDYDVSTVAHLTCQGLTRQSLAKKSARLKEAGIKNVLALRGDPNPEAAPGDFEYASDMIPQLVEGGFCVGAAAYPEGHISCLDPDIDVAYLRGKQDAGASFLVTQLFFDNQLAYRFRERCHKAGITVPITFGVMPFLSKSQVSRMIFMCGASLPSAVVKLLARYEDDPESLRAAGIEYACAQLQDLATHGVDGLHIYTMNRPQVAAAAVAAIREVL